MRRHAFVLGKLRRICNVPNCPRVHHAKGLCRYHYNRLDGHLIPGERKYVRVCQVPECRKPPMAQGYCDKHYKRWQRHGDPTVVLKRGRKPKAPAPKSGSLERPEPTLVDAGSNGEVPLEAPDPALFRALSDSAPRPGTSDHVRSSGASTAVLGASRANPAPQASRRPDRRLSGPWVANAGNSATASPST